MQHANYGRDYDLARGWLIVLDALEAGRDPRSELQAFVNRHFTGNNNNGMPQTLADYPSLRG